MGDKQKQAVPRARTWREGMARPSVLGRSWCWGGALGAEGVHYVGVLCSLHPWPLAGSLGLALLHWRVGPVSLSYHSFRLKPTPRQSFTSGSQESYGSHRAKIQLSAGCIPSGRLGESPCLCLFQPLGAPQLLGLSPRFRLQLASGPVSPLTRTPPSSTEKDGLWEAPEPTCKGDPLLQIT